MVNVVLEVQGFLFSRVISKNCRADIFRFRTQTVRYSRLETFCQDSRLAHRLAQEPLSA